MKTLNLQGGAINPIDIKKINAQISSLDHQYLALFNFHSLPSKIQDFKFTWFGYHLLEFSESDGLKELNLVPGVIAYVENNYADSTEGLDAIAKMLNLIYEVDTEYFPTLTSAQRIMFQWILLQRAFSIEFYDNVIAELPSFTSEEATDMMRDIVKTLYFSYVNQIDTKLRTLYPIHL